MTEIDDIHLAKDKRKTGRHNKEEHAGYQSVQELEKEIFHGVGPPSGGERQQPAGDRPAAGGGLPGLTLRIVAWIDDETQVFQDHIVQGPTRILHLAQVYVVLG